MCNNVIVGQKCDVDTSYTKSSNLTFRNFIQNLTKETELSGINLIRRPFWLCQGCAELLDSLDLAQTTARRLQDSLLKYLTNSILFRPTVREFESETPVNEHKQNVCENSLLQVGFHENEEKVKIEENGAGTPAAVLRPHRCSVCSKSWRTASELKSHAKTHSNMKYICEVCGQAYKQKSHFNVHMGMHGGIHPFTCEWCNKSFTQKGALQRHRLLHTGKKESLSVRKLSKFSWLLGDAPHQCEACGKCFVHASSFRIHRLSHSGRKDHKCDRCGLALVSGSHLKRHMRVHSGEKPYPCTTCGRRFAERYNLAAHTKTHAHHTAYL